jgi:hypothetical protein
MFGRTLKAQVFGLAVCTGLGLATAACSVANGED